MTTFIAFLRGINVGGNVMLPMKKLAGICEDIGFENVRTYINSGNVIFESNETEEELKIKLEKALFKNMGRKIDVIIRKETELKSIIKKNPFPKTNSSQVGVLLFAKSVSKSFAKEVEISGPEEVVISGREVFINFPNGMGKSKLKLPPVAKTGTVRNMNTISKLATLAAK